MRSRIWFLRAILATGLTVACGGSQPGESELVVFAAASLRDVAKDLAQEFESRHATRVIFNFAGSNTLAQQIGAAPGADVFLSADEEWVDFLDEAARTVPGSRRAFLSNSLVLIAHRDASHRWSDPLQLAHADYRFLVLADPAAVPAGRYARAALERLPVSAGMASHGMASHGLASDDGNPPHDASLWSAVEGRVAPALDVRAALALVESDPEVLGIVYRTDTMSSPRIRVLYDFPPLDGAPITYSATLIAGGAAPELGRRLIDFLISPEAGTIAESYGFIAAER